jgi:hypothetical protein
MPFHAKAVAVTDQPTLIMETTSGPPDALIRNLGPRTVFVGGEDVSVSEGFPIESGDALKAVFIGHAAKLYGIIDSGQAEIRAVWES